MLKNYLKVFFRNLWKHAGYSVSNVSGLSVGMVACILVLLFVRYEFTWNTYNENYDLIGRIQQKVLFKNSEEIYGQTGYAVAPEIKNKIPEIETATPVMYIWDEYLSSSDELQFLEEHGVYAYTDLFRIFTYKLLEGNPRTALEEPFSIILTREMANKYFPGQDAYGKTLKSSRNRFLKVTGIIENLPYNLDFRPDYLVSFSTLDEVYDWKEYNELKNISNGPFFTLALLKPGVSIKEVNSKLYNFMDSYIPDNFKKLYFKPVSELHLTANEKNDIKVALWYMSGIAVFMLILACINFINLSTANSNLRKKEIGIRKVVGASKFSLFRQFIGESLFYCFISMIIAFMLVELLLPPFNTIVQRPLSLNYIKDFNFVLAIAAAFIITGFLSGVYPALYLSSFRPAEVIKGNLAAKRKRDLSKSFFRRSLVTFQFIISVSLIISTIYIVKQVDYMNNKDLGFTKENLLVCKVFGDHNEGTFRTLRTELLSNSSILDATMSQNAPFNGYWGKEINWEGVPDTEKEGVSYNSADYHFIDTYNMKIVMGRNFSEQFKSDTGACLINETAMQRFGWKDPIGKKIDDNRYTVIGVVKDYHFYSVHVKIPAAYITLDDSLKNANVFAVRIKPGNRDAAAAFVRNTFRSFFPGAIVEVADYSKRLDLGTKDVWEIVEKVFFSFAIVTILIAANGLFGLVSFSAQRRIKEIGIRKVLGANIPGLYIMMSTELLIILVIAVIISLPGGYVVSVTTPGAYKYKMQLVDYLLATGIMFFTAFAATVYQTTKAVLSNPVESLKYE